MPATKSIAAVVIGGALLASQVGAKSPELNPTTFQEAIQSKNTFAKVSAWSHAVSYSNNCNCSIIAKCAHNMNMISSTRHGADTASGWSQSSKRLRKC